MTKYRIEYRNTSMGETSWVTYRGSSEPAVRAKFEKELREWFNSRLGVLPQHIKIVDITEIQAS